MEKLVSRISVTLSDTWVDFMRNEAEVDCESLLVASAQSQTCHGVEVQPLQQTWRLEGCYCGIVKMRQLILETMKKKISEEAQNVEQSAATQDSERSVGHSEPNTKPSTGCDSVDYERCIVGVSAENRTRPEENETMPAEIETRPTENRTRPTENEARPETNKTRPTENGTRPAETGTRPETNRTRLAENGTKSAENGTRPAENGKRLTENETRPDKNGTRPAENWTRPAENWTRPAENGKRLTENETRPDTNGTRVAENRTRPAENWTRPETNETRPAENGTKPKETVKNEVKPVEEKAKSAENVVKPAERMAKPEKNMIRCAEKMVRTTEYVIRPLQNVVRPVENVVRPVENVVRPVENVVKPAAEMERRVEKRARPDEVDVDVTSSDDRLVALRLLPSVHLDRDIFYHLAQRHIDQLTIIASRCSIFEQYEDSIAIQVHPTQDFDSVMADLKQIISRVAVERISVKDRVQFDYLVATAETVIGSKEVQLVFAPDKGSLSLIGPRDQVERAKEVIAELTSGGDMAPPQMPPLLAGTFDFGTGHHRTTQAPAPPAQASSTASSASTSSAPPKSSGYLNIAQRGVDHIEFSLGYLAIRVAQGDVTRLDSHTDVVVSFIDHYLNPIGRLADHLAASGGPLIRQELDSKKSAVPFVKTGHLVDTNAGQLPWKRLIHVVRPTEFEFPPKQERSTEALRQTFLNCMTFANDHLNTNAIAFPEFGSDDYSAAVVAHCFLEAIQFFDSLPRDHRHLHFIQLVTTRGSIAQQLVAAILELIRSYNTYM